MTGQFTLDISRFVAFAKGNIDLVVRKIALELDVRLVAQSPIDTGRFKGNWQVGIDAKPAGDLPDRKGASASLAEAQAKLVRGSGAGHTIYIVNNLPYANALENGHSKQAPSGMVKVTLQEFPGIVSAAAQEVRA